MLLILTSESSKSLPAVASHLGPSILRKRFGCITTAATPFKSKPWVDLELERLRSLGAVVQKIDISELPSQDALQVLDDSEGIFVHGGNTFYLLQEMQRIGFDKFIRQYLTSGRPYIGSSAGTLVAGPSIDINAQVDQIKDAPSVDPHAGLALIPFAPLVHFDVSNYWPEYRVAFERALNEGVNLFPIRDDQFLVVKDDAFRLVTGS